MSDAAFLLVIIALGVAFYIYFERMKRRHSKRHPNEENPIRRWLRGKDKDDNP
jgi:hypothetical protein